MGDMINDLKQQGVAVLVMISIAIVSVLGMIILSQFQTAVDPVPGALNANDISVNGLLVNTTIAAFIAGFAIVGTFATVTMLIIVTKAIIGVVKGLQS